VRQVQCRARATAAVPEGSDPRLWRLPHGDLRRCETPRQTNRRAPWPRARATVHKSYLIKPRSNDGDQSSPPWSENRHSDDAQLRESRVIGRKGPCDAAAPLLITDPPVFLEIPRGMHLPDPSAAGGSRNNSSEALRSSAAGAQRLCSPASCSAWKFPPFILDANLSW
jgi:hypothetical protein